MPKLKKAAKKEAEIEIKKGMRLAFTIEGDDQKGTVTEVAKNGDFTVENDDGVNVDFEASEAGDVEILEEEAEEKPVKKGKPGKAKKEAEEEVEEEEEKPKGKKGTRSLAGAWRSTERAARGGGGFPVGAWEAIVAGGEAAETDKGVSAYLGFVGVNDDEVNGLGHRKYYQLFDADGEPQEQGIGYFKADLHDIGVDDDDIDAAIPDTEDMEEFIDALNKFLKKVAKARPWLSVKVVPAKKKGYGNSLYVQGLMEDQDEKPELDEDNLPV